MKQGCLAILDSDKEYLDRLGEYLNEKEFVSLHICIFSEQDKFDEFLKEGNADMILVVWKLWKDEYEALNAVVLYENPQEMSKMPEGIYKYQSARLIGEKIMDLYAKTAGDRIFFPNKKEACLYGVFPVGEENTAALLAWEIAKYLGREKKVLYISMKAFSGMRSRLDINQENSLSDCIFFMRKREGNLLVKLQAVICQGEGFDYLPSMESEDDIRDVSADEWKYLLTEITKNLDYEMVVLDLSEVSESFLFWLELCDLVFSPLSGEFVNIRISERRKWIESRNQKELLDKWVLFPGERIRLLEPYGFRRNPDVMQQIAGLFREKGVSYGQI